MTGPLAQLWPTVRVITAPPINAIETASVGEALMQRSREPVLALVPHCVAPGLSIGYFQSWRDVPPGRAFVRRLTPGAMVDAEGAFSAAMIVPAGHPRCSLDAATAQTTFNEAIAEALADLGISAKVEFDAPEFEGREGGEFGQCFLVTYRYDIAVAGEKIAASSLFRSPYGVLQETGIRYPGMDVGALAEAVIRHVVPLCGATGHPSRLTPEERVHAETLHASRYSTLAWNRAR